MAAWDRRPSRYQDTQIDSSASPSLVGFLAVLQALITFGGYAITLVLVVAGSWLIYAASAGAQPTTMEAKVSWNQLFVRGSGPAGIACFVCAAVTLYVSQYKVKISRVKK